MSSKQILHTTQRIRCNGSLFSFVCTILLSMWKNKHTAHTNCTLTLTLNFSIVFHRRIATCDYCERTSCAVASYTIFSSYLDHFCNPLLLPSDFFSSRRCLHCLTIFHSTILREIKIIFDLLLCLQFIRTTEPFAI